MTVISQKGKRILPPFFIGFFPVQADMSPDSAAVCLPCSPEHLDSGGLI